MSHIAYICLILFFIFINPSSQIPLSSTYHLDYQITESDFQLTLLSENKGWLGLGLGSSMFSAEMFICNYDSNNQLQVFHYDSVDESKPHLINTQPVILLSGFRNTTHTSCTFKRSLIAANLNSKTILFDQPMDIIYAYGKTDVLGYHIKRDQTKYVFFTCGSYCDICDNINKICQKCVSPAILVNSICQISINIISKYSLSFYLSDNNSDAIFTMTAQNQGWVALGLGRSMFSADIFMCNSTNNIWKIYEYKSTDENTPTINPIQKVELLNASRNSTHTSCKFKRKLTPNDLNDTIIYTNQKTNIIYAYGNNDIFKYHTNRGDSIITIQKSLGYNNNKTLCLKGDLNSNCIQCKYSNYLLDLNGRCNENLSKESYQFINDKISVYYYIVGNNSLSITLIMKSQGWIAFGLGSSMFKADIFMCNMNTIENIWQASELKSTDETQPSLDQNQNILLLSAFRNTTHTSCTFQRDLTTNDISDSVITIDKNQNIIYAMGSTDTFDYHSMRGQFKMFFNNNSKPICDNLCLECVANNICKTCLYSNFMVINGICEENFKIEKSLLHTTNFSLFYYLIDENTLSLTMISNQLGWVALGLISQPMNDLLMCHQNNQNWSAQEFKYNNTDILLSDNQNIDLIKAYRNATHTSCTIKRQLKTNDSQDIEILKNKKINISYGYDTTDSFQVYLQKGVLQQVEFTNRTSSNCPLSLCSQCNTDNTTCLKCKYDNYNLVSGLCVENYAIEKFTLLSPFFSLYYFLDDSQIFISLISQSQGWIGLGLGSSMSNADIFMCNKSTDDVFTAWEMKSTGERRPNLSSNQNIEFITGSRNSTHTLCAFRRDFKTNDPNDKQILVNKLNDVIYAIGSSDRFSFHDARGSVSVNFSNSTVPAICPANCLKCDSNGQCISCKENNYVVIKGACELNDIEILQSSAEILPNFLYLYWEFSSDNTTVKIMIKTTHLGYVSLGIGNCMDNCDIQTVEYDQNSNVKLRDMYSSSQTAPNDDNDLGGTSDLILLGYGRNDSYMLIKYERKVNTGDKWDFSLDQGDKEMAYAFSSGKTLEYHNHDNRGKFVVAFVQGYTGSVTLKEENQLTRIHGIFMFIAWGGLIDIALFFARYMKSFRWYIEIHGFLMFVTCIVSTLMEILIIYKNRESIANLDGQNSLVNAHFIIGVIIMGLCFFELAIGFIINSLIKKRNKFVDNRNYKLIHMILGILIYLLTKANVGIGIKIYKEILLFPLIIYYIILFSAKGVIEFIFRLELKIFKKTPKIPEFLPLLTSELVSKINQNEPRELLLKEFPQISWIILDTQIYDISSLKHPGGNYILEQIKGREIGRFFYGISGLESLPLPGHKHSLYAFNYLSSRLIGTIDNPMQILVSKKNEIGQENSVWIINEKKDLSKTTSIFRFRCSEFMVKNYMKGVEWMGKHFTVQELEQNNKLTRLYTTVLCYSEQNISLREKILYNYENIKSNGFEEKIQEKKEENEISLHSDELSLVIKKYNHPKAFSNYIHNNTKSNYVIRGNFGNGLELNKNSSGLHYIFCGGTGILPFLDLLDYLLKKAIFTDLHQNFNSEELISLNAYKEDYIGSLNNNFKLILFASFANDEEFIGADIITKLYEIVKEKNMDWFDMKIRIADKNTIFKNIPVISGYFDNKFLIENLKKDNLKKIYICGPAFMNKKLNEELLNYQINGDIIHFV